MLVRRGYGYLRRVDTSEDKGERATRFVGLVFVVVGAVITATSGRGRRKNERVLGSQMFWVVEGGLWRKSRAAGLTLTSVTGQNVICVGVRSPDSFAGRF
jgi:hypothetical protein